MIRTLPSESFFEAIIYTRHNTGIILMSRIWKIIVKVWNSLKKRVNAFYGFIRTVNIYVLLKIGTLRNDAIAGLITGKCSSTSAGRVPEPNWLPRQPPAVVRFRPFSTVFDSARASSALLGSPAQSPQGSIAPLLKTSGIIQGTISCDSGVARWRTALGPE